MIGRLRGVLVAKHLGTVILDVGGVGYEVAVAPSALAALPGIGEEAVVHTHLYVREDQLALYGFADEDGRELFRLLLGVSGIGPKVALGILGTLQPDELRQAVVADDIDALVAVPGIGKRSAQKLMLELRPKLEILDLPRSSVGTSSADVREALESLGYQPTEIRDVMRELPQDLAVEELLRLSLQELGKQGRA
jgi:Holliday junction DNA helicase RuvA